ncbi:hypothetical protein BDZ45DRAFT_777778 [Acephala macrosclerotiorum]|nr:hypothetical protein BDZ45DRAFT_777778 [Acephala macrosclerotiorum]
MEGYFDHRAQLDVNVHPQITPGQPDIIAPELCSAELNVYALPQNQIYPGQLYMAPQLPAGGEHVNEPPQNQIQIGQLLMIHQPSTGGQYMHMPLQDQMQPGQFHMVAPQLCPGERDIRPPQETQMHSGQSQAVHPAFYQAQQTAPEPEVPRARAASPKEDILVFISKRVHRLELLAHFGLQRRQAVARVGDPNPAAYIHASADCDASQEAAEIMKSVLKAAQVFIGEQQAEIQRVDNDVKETIDIMRQAVVDKQKEISRKEKEIMALKEANNSLLRAANSVQKPGSDLNSQLDITEQDFSTQQITPPGSQPLGGGGGALISVNNHLRIFKAKKSRRPWKYGEMEALDKGVSYFVTVHHVSLPLHIWRHN